MSGTRVCCKPGCPHCAVATLTYDYSRKVAVVGPLGQFKNPHSWDLCADHANRVSVPKGWELVRHRDVFVVQDDLTAIADSVRETPARVVRSASWSSIQPVGHAAREPIRAEGRRRGHLRVLPDLTD